jgi:hypothetical protein
MGLIVRVFDIVSPNDFDLSIGLSPYGPFTKLDGPRPDNSWPNSTDRDYRTEPIYIGDNEPEVVNGIPPSSEVIFYDLEFDTEFWLKMEDKVNVIDVCEDNQTPRYIVENIYIHDSKTFECYDKINFSVSYECVIPPTPTPAPSSTPGTTPTPTPSPTGEVIDDKTEINIFFDDSGSMGTTEAPLNTMATTILKDCLLPFYNNDSALYDSRVRVIRMQSIGRNERSYACISTTGTTSSITKVINLSFQDEGAAVYHGGSTSGWSNTTNRTNSFNADITTLRNNIDNNPTNYLIGEIFQVQTQSTGQYLNFKNLLIAVENGLGNYSGVYGLSDKPVVHNTYDVSVGVSGANSGPGSPQYYMGLIITAINNLGYSVPDCTE